jgi:RNA polymerase sigma factor (sigma-70 family)
MEKEKGFRKMLNLTDEELMLRYQKGDMPAMDELLRRYKNSIYHYALRLSRNVTQAQDIAQEVFLRVHQYRANYRPIAKFCTWVFNIAHNLYVSKLRKDKWLTFWPRKKDDPDVLMDFPSPDPSASELVEKDEVCAILKKSLQGLPLLQREALILREYENMDYQQIAEILNKSLGTVKTLIHRARENLKQKLLPYAEEFKGGYHV